MQLFSLVLPVIRLANRSPRELWKSVTILWHNNFVCEVNHQHCLSFDVSECEGSCGSKNCQLQYPCDFIVYLRTLGSKEFFQRLYSETFFGSILNLQSVVHERCPVTFPRNKMESWSEHLKQEISVCTLFLRHSLMCSINRIIYYFKTLSYKSL